MDPYSGKTASARSRCAGSAANRGQQGYLASLAIDRAQNWTVVRGGDGPLEGSFREHRLRRSRGQHRRALRGSGADPQLDWTCSRCPGAGNYQWSRLLAGIPKLPHSFNPTAGFTATANHKMIPEHYPYNVGLRMGAALSLRAHPGCDRRCSPGAPSEGEVSKTWRRCRADIVSLPARATPRAS